MKTALLLPLVIIIWGSNFVVIKIGVAEMNSLMLLAMRFGLAGLLFVPFMKWPGWKKARIIILVGILMGLLHQGLLYVGMQTVSAGAMSILMQFNVILVTLIGWLFLKEKIGWRTWTGIAVGVLGVIILVGKPDMSSSGIGYIYGFISTIFLALAYVTMKKLDTVHPQTYIALMHLPVAPMIFLSSLVFEGTVWMQDPAALKWDIIFLVVAYQAIILSISHIFWQKLLVENPVSKIIPYTLLIPLVGVGFSVLFLHEALTFSVLIGGALTVMGVGIVTFRRIKKNEV